MAAYRVVQEYVVGNAPDYGCASCVTLRETSSLRMILGSKHVGAILNVLM